MRLRDPFRTPKVLRNTRPVRVVVFGYFSYALLGWILLSLPWMHREPGIGALDHLFMATSAMSTTGLVTVSPVDSYNLAGQIVLLLLIQAGGLGYMTLGSFVVLARGSKFSDFRRRISRVAFPLPRSFREEPFVRAVVTFAVLVEAAGAVVLYFLFRRSGVEDPVWQAIFHSVSAFCTAGFSLFNNSLEGFAGDFWVNATVAALSYGGAVGFIVWLDLWEVLSGKKRNLTLTSRIILWMTLWISVGGWMLLFLSEPSMQSMPAPERLMASGFQAMTALTTVGFNTAPIGGLSAATVILMLVLMIVGASPAGTGGGLKSTTVSAALASIRTAFRGDDHVSFAGCRIPEDRLRTAHAAASIYLLALAAGTFLLTLVETQAVEDLIFEAVSALGTVGLSRGATGDLTALGKLVIIALMFVGRLGPLTFGVALATPGEAATEREDDLVV